MWDSLLRVGRIIRVILETMRLTSLIIIVLSLLVIFVSGIQVGILLKLEKAVEENYFDSFPSPLACHADNSCSLKDLNIDNI